MPNGNTSTNYEAEIAVNLLALLLMLQLYNPSKETVEKKQLDNQQKVQSDTKQVPKESIKSEPDTTKKLRLQNLVAFVDLMRDALLFRTITSRAYALHLDVYEQPAELERDESIFAITSLFYTFSALLSWYLKDQDIEENVKNKMLYNVIDGLTWSVISILRFPGHVFNKLDASEWGAMSENIVADLVLGAYAFELVYTFYIDCKQLDYYQRLLKNTTDPEKKAEYQYEVAKYKLAVGTDLVYLAILITGVALNIFLKGNPAGLMLMVSVSALNQIKNLIIACVDLNNELKKYDKKLNELDLNYPDKNSQEYISGKKELDAALYKAQKKFGTELIKVSFILASLAVLAFGNPIGMPIFVMALAVFATYKIGLYAYDKHVENQTNKSLLTPSYENATAPDTKAASLNLPGQPKQLPSPGD